MCAYPGVSREGVNVNTVIQRINVLAGGEEPLRVYVQVRACMCVLMCVCVCMPVCVHLFVLCVNL